MDGCEEWTNVTHEEANEEALDVRGNVAADRADFDAASSGPSRASFIAPLVALGFALALGAHPLNKTHEPWFPRTEVDAVARASFEAEKVRADRQEMRAATCAKERDQEREALSRCGQNCRGARFERATAKLSQTETMVAQAESKLALAKAALQEVEWQLATAEEKRARTEVKDEMTALAATKALKMEGRDWRRHGQNLTRELMASHSLVATNGLVVANAPLFISGDLEVSDELVVHSGLQISGHLKLKGSLTIMP